MGVDTRLFISNRWSVKDLADVIEKRFGCKPVVRVHQWAPDYLNIDFSVEGEQRMLHVHTNSEYGGFQGWSISLRSNDQGIRVLTEVAKTFGGFLCEADTDSTFVEFSAPDHGDAAFLLNEALKDNPELGRDVKALAEWLKNWKVEREQERKNPIL